VSIVNNRFGFRVKICLKMCVAGMIARERFERSSAGPEPRAAKAILSL